MRDRLLSIDKNGIIIGLPSEFRPSELDLLKKEFRISDKKILFPNWLVCYIDISDNVKIKLTASWHHSKEIMPYYLNLEVFDEIENFGHSILFNIETLDLIALNELRKKGDSIYNSEIKLEEKYLIEYKNSIKTVKQ